MNHPFPPPPLRRPKGSWSVFGATTLALGAVLGGGALEASGLVFTETAEEAGVAVVHAFTADPTEPRWISGGVAAGDLDRDGWTDLLVVRGTAGPPALLFNRGDGSFESRDPSVAGLDLDHRTLGPTFADLDGDGALDLLVGGIDGAPPRLFRNRGSGTFDEVTDGSGILSQRDTFSAAAGDYDRDGDLDLFLAHWSRQGGGATHLWRNGGGFQFSPVDWRVGIARVYLDVDFTFTPNFSDLDGDGWPELLVAGDFGTSQVFRNGRDGSFEIDPRFELDDENGMGSAIGDFDNDGHLDWFVSSIWDPDGVAEGNWGITGNRLYRNRGDGLLEDHTTKAGVRQGYWGWGACAGDFDNDGWLDLFHTNGFLGDQAADFNDDPSRLWLNRGDGTFDERSGEAGLVETGQGRGVVCFDYDRDGDLDLFVQVHSGTSKLFRNDLASPGDGGPHALVVRLEATGANRRAVGARVVAESDGHSQVRELRAGSNFLSQNPHEVHFGLADADRVDRLTVSWPDGRSDHWTDLAADRTLTLRQGEGNGTPPEIPTLGRSASLLLAALLVLATLRRLARDHLP